MAAAWSTAEICRLIVWLLVSAIIVTADHCDQPSCRRDKCPRGWLGPHLKTCYRMSTREENWDRADRYGCRRLYGTGAHLAAITLDNKAFLSKQVEFLTPSDYWVGLRSSDDAWNKRHRRYATEVQDGSFTWASLGYSNPGNSINADSDCVVADADGWADNCVSGCASKFASLCQLFTADSACPEGWESLDGHCFRVNTNRLTWEEAGEACPTLHDSGMARLATPEFDISKSTLFDDVDEFWIALRSTRDENGRFRWSDEDNTVVTHTFWADLHVKQAPLRAGTDDDCVRMIGMTPDATFTRGELIDGRCDDKLPCLCELKLR